MARGWASKLSSVKAAGAALLATTPLSRLSPAALALLQHGLLCTLPLAALVVLTERLQRGSSRSTVQR